VALNRLLRELAHLIELGEIRRHIEPRILDARDDQGGLRQAGARGVRRGGERGDQILAHVHVWTSRSSIGSVSSFNPSTISSAPGSSCAG
jgi:hypothetical protein